MFGVFFNQLMNFPKLIMFVTFLLSFLWILIAFNAPLLSLTENQNLYIYSTQAQVLSAIYGLTLTGYIFLRNHQEREIERDNSLSEIIKNIQGKEYKFLIMLTIISIIAILLDLLSLSLYLKDNKVWSILAKNSATVFFINGLLLITFFILKALKADKYNEVSKEIMKDAEKNIRDYVGADSYMEAQQVGGKSNEHMLYGLFMSNFIELENKLFNLYEVSNLTKMVALSVDSFPRRKPTLTRLLKELIWSGSIPQALGSEISSLIKYRNALVHTTDVEPSQKMVSNVKNINEIIEAIINEYNHKTETKNED